MSVYQVAKLTRFRSDFSPRRVLTAARVTADSESEAVKRAGLESTARREPDRVVCRLVSARVSVNA